MNKAIRAVAEQQRDELLKTLASLTAAQDPKLATIAGDIVAQMRNVRVIEEQLETERRQLASVIEATEVAIWEYDIPGDAVKINDRYADMLGYARAELEPVSLAIFLGLIHPDDQPQVKQALNDHLVGESRDFECEIRMRAKTGEWIWILTRGRVLVWSDSGEPVRMFGVHLNIQERKTQDESLRRISDTLNSTGRLGQIGGWELDLQTDQLVWTDETKRIHGVPLDYEPALESAIAFYAPEAQGPIAEAVENLIKTGEPWDLEVPLVRANGERIWVHAQGAAVFDDGTPIRLFGAFQDITERRELLQTVSRGREFLHVTLQSIGDGVITTDPQGRILWLNPVAERLTGWSPDAAEGAVIQDVFTLLNESTREPLDNPVIRCLDTERTGLSSSNALLLARDGEERSIEDSASPIVSDEGEVMGAVLVFRDVTEQRRLSGEMRYRARHDALTGLKNRVEFETRLEKLISDKDSNHEHGVLFIDLDQFKVVNDTCGHYVGDELLQRIASILQSVVRTQDLVARLGGDEFGIILERCPATKAQQIAEDVCEHVQAFRFVHKEHRFRIGSSVGLVRVHSDWADVSAVLQAADTACYAAKAAGRGRVHFFEESDKAIVSQRSETRWIRRIEDALDHDRFVVHFQPILAAKPSERAAEVPRLELLLRMISEDGELIPPGAFLPVAERFDLSSRIDRWVLKQALEWLDNPQIGNTKLFVNLSGRSLSDLMFQKDVKKTLEVVDRAKREQLVFEITETAMISSLKEARDFIEALQDLGVSIALDDFGSGMSSFGYLRSLPINYLKIDGQFVTSMLEDDLAMAAVRSFVDVASVLNVPTVAEHVDNEAVVNTLVEMGVHFVQGYYLGRPHPQPVCS